MEVTTLTSHTSSHYFTSEHPIEGIWLFHLKSMNHYGRPLSCFQHKNLTLLEKKGAKRVFRCPVYGTLALEPSKRFQKIQEPFGEPLKVLQCAQGTYKGSQGTYKGSPECPKNLQWFL